MLHLAVRTVQCLQINTQEEDGNESPRRTCRGRWLEEKPLAAVCENFLVYYSPLVMP